MGETSGLVCPTPSVAQPIAGDERVSRALYDSIKKRNSNRVGRPRYLLPAFLSSREMKIRRNIERIDDYRDHIPNDYWPRQNQQAVVDPEDLEDTHNGYHSWIHAGA